MKRLPNQYSALLICRATPRKIDKSLILLSFFEHAPARFLEAQQYQAVSLGGAGGWCPAAPLTCEGQHVPAVPGSGGNARQLPIGRWVSGSFIAALYLLVAFAGIAIVVRV